MKRRGVALATLFLLMLVCITGCGNSENDDTETFASQLYALKNPYIENTSANNDLVRAVGAASYGKYTLSVQDSAVPYTLEIRYMYLSNDVDETTMDGNMVSMAAVLLALIDDCGQVAWSYPGADGLVQSGVTTEYVNSAYGTDVKAAGDSLEAFQVLCDQFFPDKAAAPVEEAAE